MAYPCLYFIRNHEDIKTNTPYPEASISRIHELQYAVFKIYYTRSFWKISNVVKIDDPNITMEEYIRLEEEKARRHGKVYNWETATYDKIWDNEDVHDLGSIETKFPAMVFNDTLTFEAALSCEPTTRSGIKNGNEPLKSILKDPKVLADKTKRNASIESTTMVWEVTDTDFPTPIKSVWRDDESDGHESCVNTLLNVAQQASKDDEINVNLTMAAEGSSLHGVQEGTDDEYNEKVDEQFDSQSVNDGNSSVSPSFASVVSPKPVTSKNCFRTFVNDERLAL
ncbi:hypothetical protein Tco_0646427 [Tanacetum coccineum]